MDLKDFIPAIKYGATSGDLGINNAGEVYLGQGLPFIASASVGTVASVAGVTLLADSVVTNSRKVYLQGFAIKNGSVAILQAAGGPAMTGFVIEDSAGTAFFTFLSTGSTFLKASELVTLSSGTGIVTSGNAFAEGTGGGVGKGLVVKLGATGTPSAGSIFTATAWGIIK